MQAISLIVQNDAIIQSYTSRLGVQGAEAESRVAIADAIVLAVFALKPRCISRWYMPESGYITNHSLQFFDLDSAPKPSFLEWSYANIFSFSKDALINFREKRSRMYSSKKFKNTSYYILEQHLAIVIDFHVTPEKPKTESTVLSVRGTPDLINVIFEALKPFCATH